MTTNPLELPEPRSLQETGIGGDQIEQLLVKTLYSGEATGLEIADRMSQPFPLLEPLIERLRNERLMEVKGSTGSGAATYRYALTDGGRERAQQYFEVSHYIGAVPVTLARYVAYMTALQAARGHMDKERLRKGFSHLIITDEVLEMVGPAVNAGKAVFLYGPPGNGKSVIAEGMGRSLGGDMYIPRAIDVDGHTVMMYDPIVEKSERSTSPKSSPNVPPIGIAPNTVACGAAMCMSAETTHATSTSPASRATFAIDARRRKSGAAKRASSMGTPRATNLSRLT